MFCSFVFVGNKHVHRRESWENLKMHKCFVTSNLWLVLGDFNMSLIIEDHSSGTSGITMRMSEFHICVEAIGIEDINRNQIPNANTNTSILKKIDRIMENNSFVQMFSNVFANFQPFRISKFDYEKEFNKVVADEWKNPIKGS